MLKRGHLLEGTLGLIIGVIGAFVLLVVFGIIFGFIGQATNIAICQTTLTASEYQHTVTDCVGGGSVLDVLDCRTVHITVFEDEYQVNGDRRGGIEKTFDNSIREIFADQYQTCWNTFSEGHADPFGNREDGESICIPCAEIEFNLDRDRKIDGLYQYMNTHDTKEIGGTYAEYLNKGAQFTDEEDLNFEIDTNKDYAIMYIVADDGFWNDVNDAIPFKTFIGEAVQICAEKHHLSMRLLEAKDVEEVCEKVEI